MTIEMKEEIRELKAQLKSEHILRVQCSEDSQHHLDRALAAEANVKALAEALDSLLAWGVKYDDERLHSAAIVRVPRRPLPRRGAEGDEMNAYWWNSLDVASFYFGLVVGMVTVASLVVLVWLRLDAVRGKEEGR